MSELAIIQHGWTRERMDLVKRTVCPKGITDDEFALFAEQCKRSGLDPLLKQAFCVPRRQNIGTRNEPNWTVKHEFQPAEAGMLARAEEFPDFAGVTASAVHEKDTIEIDPAAGQVTHRFSPVGDRGKLMGAWARLERDGRTPIVAWLDLLQYRQESPLWSKIPGTMIIKCARVAVLRVAYPAAFGGLYIREEMPAEEHETPQRMSKPADVYATVVQAPPARALPPADRDIETLRGRIAQADRAQLTQIATEITKRWPEGHEARAALLPAWQQRSGELAS